MTRFDPVKVQHGQARRRKRYPHKLMMRPYQKRRISRGANHTQA
jgi:hypothetical protein